MLFTENMTLKKLKKGKKWELKNIPEKLTKILLFIVKNY